MTTVMVNPAIIYVCEVRKGKRGSYTWEFVGKGHCSKIAAEHERMEIVREKHSSVRLVMLARMDGKVVRVANFHRNAHRSEEK